MGIQVEFNPDLALRNISACIAEGRQEEECIPEKLEVGEEYAFLKIGQRNYWFDGEVPLLETEGMGKLSRPKASIRILEATHFMQGDAVYTRGRYRVVAVFHDDAVHFESYQRRDSTP